MADRDQSHLDATRAQVNEVQNIMKNNVDKIMEREGKLSDLEGRADQLQASLKKYLYIYRVSHRYVDNFRLNFAILITTYSKK